MDNVQNLNKPQGSVILGLFACFFLIRYQVVERVGIN